MNFGGCFHVCGSQLELNVYFFKKPILGTLPSLSPKHAKSSPEAILKDLQTQPQKSFQDASRRPFKGYPRSNPKVIPEDYKQTGRHTDRDHLLLALASYGCHWQVMAVIDKLWLSLASYGCHWRAVTEHQETDSGYTSRLRPKTCSKDFPGSNFEAFPNSNPKVASGGF